ncbi:MAG: acetyl-CoA carboxylase, carboxyltransferase subunit beta [Candidatus Sumerlaeaceae bacterium]|nr:acetyl-CoA carboxylase, carboxyltransferase subunit beta [Candidatus Sumerlaeaceae bacterium]
MVWFKKEKYTTLKPPVMKDRIPEGLWTKCENCFNMVLTKDFEENLKVCKKCNHHHRLSARERIAMLADEGTFQELFAHIKPTDPLGFVDSKPYSERLKSAQKSSGYDEAVIVGTCEMDGIPVALGVMVFEFVGGSMGSVVGERITRLIEYAADHALPLVIISASGGARMQEGILSLMQMAKTSAALARLAEKKVPYISVLTNPTTAGVMASYASLGDVIIAEPDALIGFAGPRVIQQTINQILPKGFQKSEFVLEHGFLDKVVHRKDLKKTIVLFLYYFAGQVPKTWSSEEGSQQVIAAAATT